MNLRAFNLIILSLTMAVQITAQVDSSDVNYSPYSVIYNHLYFLQPESYFPGRAAQSLPPTTEAADQKAIRLKQVLDGKGMFIDLNRLPRNPGYIDTLSKEAIYFLSKSEQKIYVERRGDRWYYSRTTLDELPALHQKIYPFGTQFITHFQAPVWQVQMLGVKLWKWLAILILSILAYLFFLFVRWLSDLALRRFLKHKMELTESAEVALKRIARMTGIILGIKFVQYMIPMLQLTPRLTASILKWSNVLSLFLFIFLVRSILRIVFTYMEKAAKKTENTMDDQLLPVIERLSLIVLWAFGVVYILDYLDVNITALLAGISIGGLALALAAQDTVKNFFGSIMIFLDKPFQIGDWIHFRDVDGTVEEVGVRSTRIRTFANSLTYVPNAILADSIIDNMGLRIYRRFKTEVGITYDTPPDLVDHFVNGIRQLVLVHPGTRKDFFEVHLNSFGAHSINILIYLFFEAPTWTDELQGKHDLLMGIMKLAEKIGVRFAFPTQTIHVEEMAQPGIPSTPFRKRSVNISKSVEDVVEEMKEFYNRQR